MSNKFLICDICKGTDSKKIIKELKKIDPDCEIVIGCHNLCGIGRAKPFVIFNSKPIIKDTIEEVVLELNKQI